MKKTEKRRIQIRNQGMEARYKKRKDSLDPDPEIKNIGDIPQKIFDLRLTVEEILILKSCLEMYQDTLEEMKDNQGLDIDVAKAMRMIVKPIDERFDNILSEKGLENIKAFFNNQEEKTIN